MDTIKRTVTLSDVPITLLIEEIKMYDKLFGMDSSKFLSKLSLISNYQQLSDLIEYMRDEDGLLPERFRDLEVKVIETVKFLNRYNHNINVEKIEFLSSVDKSINGDILLYGSVLDEKTKKGVLSGYSIYDLKQNPKAFGCFGSKELIKLSKSIEFYDEHIARLFAVYGNVENLFFMDKDEKDILIEKQIQEIVNYLLDHANVCVWGELTPSQKKKMVQAAYDYASLINELARKALINNISNYVTLDEAKNGLVRTRTIDRFIVE